MNIELAQIARIAFCLANGAHANNDTRMLSWAKSVGWNLESQEYNSFTGSYSWDEIKDKSVPFTPPNEAIQVNRGTFYGVDRNTMMAALSVAIGNAITGKDCYASRGYVMWPATTGDINDFSWYDDAAKDAASCGLAVLGNYGHDDGNCWLSIEIPWITK